MAKRTVADFVDWARIHHGLSQAELARSLHVHWTTLWRVKTGVAPVGGLGWARLRLRAFEIFGEENVGKFFELPEPRQD